MPDHTKNPRQKRKAEAKATLELAEELRDGWPEPPTSDTALYEAARTAARQAARRAGDVVSGLAPAELTDIELAFTRDDEGLLLRIKIVGFSRGRLDGRASLAVNAAATAVVEKLGVSAEQWRLGGVRVVRGGIREYGHFEPPIDVAVLSVSDAVAAGDKDDSAGRAVREALKELSGQGIRLGHSDVLGDDADAIEGAVRRAADAGCEVVFTVGGTGLTHTDVTVETIQGLIDCEIPGIMEAARQYGQERTALAMLSRGIAGLMDETLLVTMPGSTSGARETAQVLLPAVFRAVVTRRKSRRDLT